jgi:hypothetical protein
VRVSSERDGESEPSVAERVTNREALAVIWNEIEEVGVIGTSADEVTIVEAVTEELRDTDGSDLLLDLSTEELEVFVIVTVREDDGDGVKDSDAVGDGE